MRKENGYQHRDALFGMPPFGGSIAQKVYYTESLLCDPNVDKHAGYPQRPLDANGVMEPWEPPFILLADRGNCTFVQKVRNAQHAGAAAVLVADTTCQCSDLQCLNKTGMNHTNCEMFSPFMADDGSASDISIPSFLVLKLDADEIRNALLQNQQLQIEMKFAIPTIDQRVEYALWTSPFDSITPDLFFADIPIIAKALGNSVYFTPHEYIHNGTSIFPQGCQGSVSNDCNSYCTNAGRYCAPDPEHDTTRGVSGADIVTESLRRLCIWYEHGANNGIGEKWWAYVHEFNKHCRDHHFTSKSCIKRAYTHSKVNSKTIKRCMNEFGGATEDKPNYLLTNELRAQEIMGIVVIPSVTVNDAVIHGQLSVNTVFSAICSGFADDSQPKICKTCSTCSDVTSCVKLGYCRPVGTNKGVSKAFFVFALICTTCMLGVLAIWDYEKTQATIRSEIRGIVSEYVPLEDEDDTPGDNRRSMSRDAATELDLEYESDDEG